MRRTSPFKLVLVLLCLIAGSALAGRPPKDFKPPEEMTPEELAASKARSKANVNDYGRDVSAETEPVPWAEILLVGLVFCGVAPFAYRAYVNTTKEIEEARASASPGRASKSGEES